jgi:hypothetical protein
MLHSRNPYTVTHQRSRIRYSFHRSDVCSKFEVIEIDATKDDAFSGWSRKDSKSRLFTGMQADAVNSIGPAIVVSRGYSWPGLCNSLAQKRVMYLEQLTNRRGLKPCTFVHTCCANVAVVNVSKGQC